MNDRHPNAPGADEGEAARGAPETPRRQEVQGPLNSLQESALAVDLAGVEFDRLIATAHKFPRRLDVVRQQLEQVVLYDEASAENAIYALPRAGKPIVGPSIGFANALAGAFGNCWDDGRWLYTDRREKIVVGGGVFVDWQTNRRTTISEQRRICDKSGRLYSEDMIVVTSKAASAVARRNAILAGVSRPLWYPTYERALYVVRGTESTLPERRERAIKALAAFGVDPKQVLLYLDVAGVDKIGVEHIPTLRGMFQQLRDGAVTVEEMFDPRRMTSMAFEKVENPLSDEGGEPGGKDGDGRAPAAAGAGASGAKPAEAGQGASAAGSDQRPADAAGAGVATGAAAQAEAPAAAKRSHKKGAAKPAAAKTGGQAAKPDAQPPEKAAEPAKAAEPPKTPEGYLAHMDGWLATEKTETGLTDRWKSERGLRTDCRVTEDAFITAKQKLETRLAEVRKG